MPETMTELYRIGSATSSRIDHVRLGKDISPFEKDGVLWVAAKSGGVSTFSMQGFGRNRWRLPQGYAYPDTLYVMNDHGNHYSWERRAEMPVADYVALLAAVNPRFMKVS
jgi:hypothetical protein